MRDDSSLQESKESAKQSEIVTGKGKRVKCVRYSFLHNNGGGLPYLSCTYDSGFRFHSNMSSYLNIWDEHAGAEFKRPADLSICSDRSCYRAGGALNLGNIRPVDKIHSCTMSEFHFNGP